MILKHCDIPFNAQGIISEEIGKENVNYIRER